MYLAIALERLGYDGSHDIDLHVVEDREKLFLPPPNPIVNSRPSSKVGERAVFQRKPPNTAADVEFGSAKQCVSRDLGTSFRMQLTF